ncbi:MAG: chemotaxis protein CheB [Elusimicrobiota bacterium]|nr:chemotaxis protein CheB [Elusimicrobiota bacterium]
MRESKTPALVVGIGASAGGVDAFVELLRQLPGDTGLAYLFLLHMSPAHKSHLSEILGRASKMPVREARDGVRLEANRVYVMPPDAAMTLRNGRLKLDPLPASARNPIDLFFRSLARDQKARAIGVVLSGMASDGTAGLEEIKAAGGITCVQDVKSAAYPGMPRAAVAAGFADIVRPPKGLARELIRLGRHPLTRVEADGDAAIFADAAALGGIFSLLRSTGGVDFSLYKPSTLRRRISRRMFLLNLARLKDYLAFLRTRPAEVHALCNDLLINVTSFFRDPKAFEVLKKRVFPRIVKGHHANAPVRVWVAGCASGEEAYSIAIAYQEFMRERGASIPVHIFATDISDEAAAKARKGLYPESIASAMSADLLRRYFVKSAQGYQVVKQLRDMCIFAHHDVTSDPPFANQDVISCRNLLIYLEPVLQKTVLSTFHYALRPEGCLLLGGAETLGPSADLFVDIDKKVKIFGKKPVRASHLDLVSGRIGASRLQAAAGPSPARALKPPPGDALAVADRLILGRFAPAGVLLDGDLEILQFRGDTGRYLKTAPGKASLNLLRMAPEGLRLDLQLLVKKAFKARQPVRKNNVWVRLDRRSRLVNLEAAAFDVPPGKERYCLLSFLPAAPVPDAGAKPAKEPRNSLFLKLKRELNETKAYLQTRIEESESRNASLNIDNEEVISSNEELQSANEELESSREELQTANEELNTLNDELRKQNAALIQLGGDLDNVLESLAIPVALLGLDLRIRRVTLLDDTPLALAQADAGRSILDIQKRLGVAGLEEKALRTLKTSRGQDLELTGQDGRWYKLRMRPYKTAQGRIEGIVLALLDADVAKRGLLELQDVMEQSMAILDSELRVQSANRRFYELFRLTPRRAQGRPFIELAGGKGAGPALLKRLRAALVDGTPFRGFELDRRLRHLGQRVLRLGAVRVPDAGRAALYVGVKDITDVWRAETAKRLAERERTQREFIANVSHELRTPVTAIKGFAQTLKHGGLDDNKHRRSFVDAIERNADRLKGLIDALLRISELDERPLPRRGKVPLRALVRRCAASAGASVRVDVPAALEVSAERGQIREVLGSLIGNAVKFGRPGSPVLVKARPAGGEAVVTVEDRGIGVPERDFPHLFERFHRGRNARGLPGSGLGLSIAQQIVAAHGGRIWADERRRRGAAFHFTLPLATRR